MKTGVVHDTNAEVLDTDIEAVTEVGESGIVNGVTELDATEAVPVPAAFTADTVNVYATPYDRPVKLNELTPAEAV